MAIDFVKKRWPKIPSICLKKVTNHFNHPCSHSSAEQAPRPLDPLQRLLLPPVFWQIFIGDGWYFHIFHMFLHSFDESTISNSFNYLWQKWMELKWWSPQGSHFRSQTHQLSVDRLRLCQGPMRPLGSAPTVNPSMSTPKLPATARRSRAGRGLRGWMMVDGKKMFVEEDRNYSKL